MHDKLREGGLAIGRHRIARLMRENGLRANQRYHFQSTTDSNHDGPVAVNLLDQNFVCTGSDQKCAADIRYLWIGEGWL